MSKLFSSKFIIAVPVKNGFVLAGQKGRHWKYKKEGYTVIVLDPK